MPMFRSFVPEWIRPWIYVFIVTVFQLTGGIYLGSLSEMVGGLSLMREDVQMCMYANLGGMAILFPILFRMKFRFTNKSLLTWSAVGIILCNWAVLYVQNLPLLWTICFISGVCKIQGTFECMSNIQSWITPQHRFTVFFPVLHIIILVNIQLSDLLTTYICYYYHWKYVHWFIIGLLIVVLLLLVTLTKHTRVMPKFPLYGVDWLGACLWAILMMEVTFLFNYGDWYDWWNSSVIRWLTVVIAITFIGCLHRMLHIRHPYLEPKMWLYPHYIPLLILITLVEVFLATEHVLEEMFYEGGLHYENLTTSVLDWWMILGILGGCLFALWWMRFLRYNFYRLLAIGFASLAIYMISFYFILSSDINIEKLYVPMIFKGFAYAVLSTTFMTCLQELMPFQHFFQGLSVFNMIHMLVGGVMGGALYARMLRYYITDNIQRYGGYVDLSGTSSRHIDFGSFMNGFMERVQLISLKQIYGWVAYACLAIFVLFLLYDMPRVRSTVNRIPSWRSVGNEVKRTFRRLPL